MVVFMTLLPEDVLVQRVISTWMITIIGHVFGEMAGGYWVVVICGCGHGCTILATFGSPDGSRGTTDAELM